MNVLLAQLDYIDLVANIVIETEITEQEDYYVDGYVSYQSEGTEIEIRVYWNASLKLIKAIDIGENFVLTYKKIITLSDFSSPELQGVSMNFISGGSTPKSTESLRCCN